MLTVLDIIHLIQYYYRTASFEYAATDVETFRLESLRGMLSTFLSTHMLMLNTLGPAQTSNENSELLNHPCIGNIHPARCTMLQSS